MFSTKIEAPYYWIKQVANGEIKINSLTVVESCESIVRQFKNQHVEDNIRFYNRIKALEEEGK